MKMRHPTTLRHPVERREVIYNVYIVVRERDIYVYIVVRERDGASAICVVYMVGQRLLHEP